jgi:hypothetical protein
MVISIIGMLAGAAAGAGIVMIVAGWFGPAAGPPALPGQHAGPGERIGWPSGGAWPGAPVPRGAEGGPLDRWTHRAAARLATAHPDAGSWRLIQVLRLDRHRQDLALLEQSVEVLLVRKAACAVAGLVLPLVLAATAAAAGLRVGGTVPVAVSAVLAVVASFLPDGRVRQQAGLARLELRRAVCAILDLVALERAADAGPAEAIGRAAVISDTPPFVRIRRALARAAIEGAPPWQGLRDLAGSTGVTELGDLADILASSGRSGAAVGTSLRARASSMRAAITAAESAAANARSEYMVIPVAALGLIFMALLAYPAIVRLATSV